MSYADSLTEADEFLTYEEGMLQGMQNMGQVVLDSLPESTQAIELFTSMKNMILEQQTLLEEMRGEEE
tara:strand:- start:53 stop:256 length:204 start_codon:yes stop_codon:yes gene_type:complete